MTEDREKIERLQTRLDNLVRTQVDFQKHVSYIREELERLKSSSSEPVRSEPPKYQVPKTEPLREPGEKHQPPKPTPPPPTTPVDPPIFNSYSGAASAERVGTVSEKTRSSFEKFVGENLLSTVGIVILIVGVAIGAKYAIDQGWISPVIRIVFGYVTGFILIGFAVRLRSKYEAFSAVLISGGMSVLFFITYFAYSLYQLIGQTTAFSLMVVITLFAVAAAISYSRQMIAHLGLVGAYAVPFLLSNDSGRFDILFSYIAIINIGILVVCLNRYWKPLFYISFIFTWVTFLGWYLDRFRDPDDFWLAFIFNGIFFLIFYISFIGYKFRSGQNVASENVVTILANSVIFYGFGYALLKDHAGFEGYLGLFTIANAAIHLLFGATANKIKTASIDFVYLLGSLVLTFITISIPVQFDGQVITLAWTVEAALLFVIGRAVAIELYEYFSYSLIVLASVNLFNDYGRHVDSIETFLSTATSFPFL
ncbi:MAG: DUF2339 domain-containing protein, partial [Pyrinomonadaceae bacterium]